MIDRREFFRSGMAAAVVASVTPSVSAWASLESGRIRQIAQRALQKNAGAVVYRDVVGVTDFSAPSRTPRLFLVDMQSGRVTSLLVAHGRGSDPAHTGWVQQFSNDFGSNASSPGAYLTGQYYEGRHGRSMRLIGLEPTNNNAEARAVVVHGAWYVSDDMIREHGKIGRSEGCFACAENDLSQVLTRLGPGRLLYAGKF